MNKNILGRTIIFFTTILALGLVGIVVWFFWGMPPLDNINKNLAIPSIRFTDRNNRTLYQLINDERGLNSPISLKSIPDYLREATIATEDQNFYTHPGIDFIGILRAFWINLRGGETLAGGSTITQQVAKNLLLPEQEQYERTLRRKLREAWLAWRITQKYSKDEILTIYLNQMYYGGMAYGVEAAARTYFGKSVTELNLAECALIAGIPQAPALYNPLVTPQASINRQKIVLNLMFSQGFISQEELEIAFRQKVIFSSSPYPIEAPHFVMYAITQVEQLIPGQLRNPSSPLIIKTTLDLDLQHLAENAISKQIKSMAVYEGELSSNSQDTFNSLPGGHNVNNAALIALEPESGAILSMVGSPDFFNVEIAGAINMSTAPRQPGSALKPIIYAAAFSPDSNDPLTAASMILDVQTAFVTSDGQSYSPANFDNLEHGPVSARQALASSLNVPAVIVLDQIGIDRLLNLASKLGISTLTNPDDYDLSLALGGGEVTLLELSSAYAAFANHGIHVEPFSISEIRTNDDQIIFQKRYQENSRVLDERVAWLISDILSDNDARSIGFGGNTVLQIDRPSAVKTGTTTNFHDNWTIGYTPELVTGVWVGNSNHEPMRGVTGLSGAGPIWHQFMREALAGKPKSWYTQPDGLLKIDVCSLSGLLPSDACPHSNLEWFIQGTEPKAQDHIFNKIGLDSETGALATPLTPPENLFTITALDLPPQAHGWARDHDVPLLVDYPILNLIKGPDNGGNQIMVISPGDRSTFFLDPHLSREEQRIHIRVAATKSLSQVDLWLDGKLLTTLTPPSFETWWILEIGSHTLRAESIDPNYGNLSSSIVHFVVEALPKP